MVRLVWIGAAVVGLALWGAAGAAAHGRDYLRTEYHRVAFQTSEVSHTCVDSEFTLLGQGGLVGGVLNGAGAAVDPLAPDLNGSCWRKNHIVPNPNGDVTFGITDQVETNVGGCLGQDVDQNGQVCIDEADVRVRFCNSITVNINLDPLTGLPGPNVWRFQDAQGVPSRVTVVVVNRVRTGSALLGPVFGPEADCGPGVDSFGTAGILTHS